MKSLILASATLFLATASAAVSQEISLFNGRDLIGWEVPKDNPWWTVENGTIVGRQDSDQSGNVLKTTGSYLDFEIELEARWGKNVDGGVHIRQALQYQIGTSPSLHKDTTGWILGKGKYIVESESAEAISRPGEWNHIRIFAKGDQYTLWLNSRQIGHVNLPGYNMRGQIGLEIHRSNASGSRIEFRNLRIKDLTSPVVSVSAPVAPPATIQTDANQPHIEVIKDQGPNATEWALTPLDEAIPADIRQNLAILREDLLDEGKKAAKSMPEAYKLASDYCDKILTALSQREIARVQAGYQAAQADANKAYSNRALDARRNYKMSWPQFSREESQRAALRENEADKANVKKQQLKVEWATRAEQMRQHLDTIYRQLREAMR